MTTPLKPWPPEWGAQYYTILRAARGIAARATGCIEYAMRIHDVYRLELWIKLINAKGLEIQNAVKAIYRGQQHTPNGTPTWMIGALEMITLRARETVEKSNDALAHFEADNWAALEKKDLPTCLALGLLMEGYLLKGPPPDVDEADVLVQVRELLDDE